MLDVSVSAVPRPEQEGTPNAGTLPQPLPPREAPGADPSVARPVEGRPPDAFLVGGAFTGFATPTRRRLGLSISLAAHVVAIAGVALIPLLAPTALPEPPELFRVRLFVPAPPPPPPPRGSGLYPRPTKRSAPSPAPSEAPRPAALTPLQLPALDRELAPAGPEPDSVLAGADGGVPEGEEGGVEGGVVGGVPGGVLGGIPGGELPVPVSSPDRPPRLLHQTRPRYPQEAFVQKVEGVVLLEILIDAEGRVARARVVQSVRLLDDAALAAVREWRFAPAVKAGRPVASLAYAPVSFRIY
jgi:protein TonB